MKKHALLGVAAALTLSAIGTAAEADSVLWSQNSNPGSGFLLSQNDAAAADDFTVPSGQTWSVSELDVTGQYFNGSGPASSEVVTFYADKNGKPGRVHRGPYTLNCADNDGSFQCTLPSSVKLGAGTWWVSLVANCDFATCGNWGWVQNTVVQGNEAAWRGPSNNGKCTDAFKPVQRCFGGDAFDMAFQLLGTSK